MTDPNSARHRAVERATEEKPDVPPICAGGIEPTDTWRPSADERRVGEGRVEECPHGYHSDSCMTCINTRLQARLRAVEAELKASNKGAWALSHALDQCERDRNTAQAEARRLWEALDRAAYALFTLKRMAPEHVREVATVAHAAACVALDAAALTPPAATG